MKKILGTILLLLTIHSTSSQAVILTFTNDSGQTANDFHVYFQFTGGHFNIDPGNLDVMTNIADYSIFYALGGTALLDQNEVDPVSDGFVMTWTPNNIFHDGDSLSFNLRGLNLSNGDPVFAGGFWTFDGVNIGALSTPQVSEPTILAILVLGIATIFLLNIKKRV